MPRLNEDKFYVATRNIIINSINRPKIKREKLQVGLSSATLMKDTKLVKGDFNDEECTECKNKFVELYFLRTNPEIEEGEYFCQSCALEYLFKEK